MLPVFYRALSYDTSLTKHIVICQLLNRQKCMYKLLLVTSLLRSETEQGPRKKQRMAKGSREI